MARGIAINALWDNVFRKGKDAGKVSKVQFLKTFPLFEGLNKRELGRVADIVYDRTYEEGEFIFEMQQPGAAMFIIKSGEVDIIVPQGHGKHLTLATLGPRDFLGELALLDNSPRSASAVATRRTEAMAFFRADLNKLLYTDPVIGCKIFKAFSLIIGIRLKITNEQLQKAGEKRPA
ncbi:MAG: cyclic nucleotide-binding domain-containing protein [Elusimicrobiota bacterium]